MKEKDFILLEKDLKKETLLNKYIYSFMLSVVLTLFLFFTLKRVNNNNIRTSLIIVTFIFIGFIVLNNFKILKKAPNKYKDILVDINYYIPMKTKTNIQNTFKAYKILNFLNSLVFIIGLTYIYFSENIGYLLILLSMYAIIYINNKTRSFFKNLENIFTKVKVKKKPNGSVKNTIENAYIRDLSIFIHKIYISKFTKVK